MRKSWRKSIWIWERQLKPETQMITKSQSSPIRRKIGRLKQLTNFYQRKSLTRPPPSSPCISPSSNSLLVLTLLSDMEETLPRRPFHPSNPYSPCSSTWSRFLPPWLSPTFLPVSDARPFYKLEQWSEQSPMESLALASSFMTQTLMLEMFSSCLDLWFSWLTLVSLWVQLYGFTSPKLCSPTSSPFRQESIGQVQRW